MVLAITTGTETARGQLTGIISSDVEGFFASQSDAYQQSEGPLTPTWPANIFPPLYPAFAGPTVPPLYTGYSTFPNPITPLTQNIGYAAHCRALAGYTIHGWIDVCRLSHRRRHRRPWNVHARRRRHISGHEWVVGDPTSRAFRIRL